MTKRETAKTNNDKSYYKNFVIPCVIFLVGYYFSAHNGICYSDFTFVVVILFIVVFVVGINVSLKAKLIPMLSDGGHFVFLLHRFLS